MNRSSAAPSSSLAEEGESPTRFNHVPPPSREYCHWPSLLSAPTTAIPALAPLLAQAPRPWGGSPASVGRANYAYRKPFHVSHGATVRAVAEMADRPRVQSVIPGGQSGHPLSDHYLDQFRAWLAGDLFEIAAEPGDVEGDVLTLTPGS